MNDESIGTTQATNRRWPRRASYGFRVPAVKVRYSHSTHSKQTNIELSYILPRPRAVEELWFAEHGEGDLIALREKELQQRVIICTRRGLVLTIAANFTLILLQMMAIRNDDAPKPIGTSGNTEEATEPEDDEYQSDDSDDMDGEASAKPF